MTRRPGRAVVPLALVIALTTACSEESTADGTGASQDLAPLLVEQDEVPGADEERSVPTLARTELCDNVASAETGLEVAAGDEQAVRELTLDRPSGQVVVETAVYGAPSPGLTQSLTRAIDACADQDPTRPLGNAQRNGAFTALTGLPGDAVGYEVRYAGEDVTTPEQRVRAYAVVDDVVVVVGARASGTAVDVDVAALLAVAVQRAEDAGAAPA